MLLGYKSRIRDKTEVIEEQTYWVKNRLLRSRVMVEKCFREITSKKTRTRISTLFEVEKNLIKNY